jgi:nitrous oxidase accessory protein NosD
MKGDYSRKTFEPRNNYAGVRMQQGRVQLDADWNEQVDIRDRRVRAQTVDLHGRCLCSEQTPNAFLLHNDAGTLTIAPGRLYVDGLLAENHGNAPVVFDEVLAEQHGTTPLSYLSQPYLPSAPELLPDAAGTVLVYLDVWYRHVTYLEDENLVEVAVGVDTATRQQAVWQVRLLENVGNITCETPDAAINGWLDIITPSGGRLSWEAVGVAEPDDPCRIPPSAGYRALENRLYRVEIHDSGTPGPATFKWSRHNGTVASRVTAIPELDTLRVESTGRDDVLRFNAGDWVEVIDDHLELEGLPGHIRRIDTVDDATRTITLRDDLPGSVFPTDAQGLTTPGRHTRVRRWDQSGVVRDTDGNLLADLDLALSPGVIPVPADGTSVVLEDGVQITFGSEPTGAPVRTGDYWSFAARAGQPELDDERTDQPPQGIHHHYCRLGIADFDGEEFVGEPTDCRHPPETEPGEGCCTVVVYPGESIQAALNSLPAEGGCVCIKTGLHLIDAALRIQGSDVCLHGESTGARIRRENGVTVLRLEHPALAPLENVAIEQLRLEAVAETGDPGGAAIVDANRCRALALRDCHISTDDFGFAVGVRIAGTIQAFIERNTMSNLGYGIWVDTDSTALNILDNRIYAASFDGIDGGAIGIWMEDAYGASRIERNRIGSFASGIYLNRAGFSDVPTSGASGTLIAGNEVGRYATGGGAGEHRIFGIDVAAWNCVVRDNVLSYRTPAYGGIRLTAPGGCIEKNRLSAARFGADDEDGDPPIGIQIGFVSDAAVRGAHGAVVRANTLAGPQDAIVVLETADFHAIDNVIEENNGDVRNAINLSNATEARVSANRILGAQFGITLSGGGGNSVNANEIRGGGSGIGAVNETDLEIEHNQLEDLRGIGMLTLNTLGMLTFKDNTIQSCGYAGLAIGIGMGNAFGDVVIESCTVQNIGVSPDGTQVVQPAFGIFGLLVLQCRVQNNLVTYSNLGENRDFAAEDRALAMLGSLEITANDIVFGFPIQILDNNFAGPAFSHLIELSEFEINDNVAIRFSRVQFNNNHLLHMTPGVSDRAEATVSLVGRSAIVMGNYFTALSFRPSVDFNGISGVYMGNDHVGGPVNFTAFPTPGNNFNR